MGSVGVEPTPFSIQEMITENNRPVWRITVMLRFLSLAKAVFYLFKLIPQDYLLSTYLRLLLSHVAFSESSHRSAEASGSSISQGIQSPVSRV